LSLKSNLLRIQLNLIPAVVKQVDETVQQIGAASRSEAIRRAIETWAHLISARADGAEIVVRYPDGQERLLVLPTAEKLVRS